MRLDAGIQSRISQRPESRCRWSWEGTVTGTRERWWWHRVEATHRRECGSSQREWPPTWIGHSGCYATRSRAGNTRLPASPAARYAWCDDCGRWTLGPTDTCNATRCKRMYQLVNRKNVINNRSFRGFGKFKKFQKSEITMKVGGWFQVWLGKKNNWKIVSQNSPVLVLICLG